MDKAIKYRPILFKGEMVRAILEGRKTQTRRVMKVQPISYNGRKYEVPDDSPERWHDADDIFEFCPFGIKGDRLWVRETFSTRYCDTEDGDDCTGDEVIYRADFEKEYEPDFVHWNPSIYMPRWASRINLENHECPS